MFTVILIASSPLVFFHLSLFPNLPSPPIYLPSPVDYHNLGEVFSKHHAISLPPHRPYDCAIELLPDSTLPTSRLYNLSRPEREAMEKYIGDSLAAGLIRPSSSPVGAGFFFVSKKDQSLRPCIDYRRLNGITIKNKYPLPLIDPAFEPLHKAKVFTRLDLRNAYHLVRIREGDECRAHVSFLVQNRLVHAVNRRAAGREARASTMSW